MELRFRRGVRCPSTARAFHHTGAMSLPRRRARRDHRGTTDRTVVFHFLRARGRSGDHVDADATRPPDRRRNARASGSRSAAARRAASPISACIRTLLANGYQARHHRRHLDRRGGRRLLRGRPARRRSRQWARGLTRRSILSYLDVSLGGRGLIGGGRLARAARREAVGDVTIEQLADALCRHRHRDRHRPRDLAHARPAGRRDARLLCAARHLSRRCSSAAAGWSTARWSIRCRCRPRARSARGW